MVIRLLIPGLNILAQVFSSVRRQVYPVLNRDFRQGLKAQRALQMPVQVYFWHPMKKEAEFGRDRSRSVPWDKKAREIWLR